MAEVALVALAMALASLLGFAVGRRAERRTWLRRARIEEAQKVARRTSGGVRLSRIVVRR